MFWIIIIRQLLVSADDLIAEGQDEGDSLTITDSDGLSYTFETYGKTYQELADEIKCHFKLGCYYFSNK